VAVFRKGIFTAVKTRWSRSSAIAYIKRFDASVRQHGRDDCNAYLLPDELAEMCEAEALDTIGLALWRYHVIVLEWRDPHPDDGVPF
jgi:hypothetical protein